MDLAVKIARLANAGCVSPRKLLASRMVQEFGIDTQLVTAAIFDDAVKYFRWMTPLLEPNKRLFQQLTGRMPQLELQEPQGDVPSPVTAVPKPVRKVTRASLFGYSITAVLRWMGQHGWNFEDAAVVCASCGAAKIADVTIRLQLAAGRKGERGPAAPLTPSQAAQLKKLAQ